MSKAEEVRKLRKSGMSIDMICLWFGAHDREHRHEIVGICRKAGMPMTEDEKKISKQKQAEQFAHDEVWAMAYIREKSHGRFEYVSGYKNMDSDVTVRYISTGQLMTRAMSTFRCTTKTNKAKRRAREKDSIIDKDITLQKVFDKDNGICYLCGKLCNKDDIQQIEGRWVVGPTYPSIEHVIPLSRGGKHSWGNVRLAHMKCNLKKGSKLPK